MKTFSERLKELRSEAGLSQGELAKTLDLQQPSISRWERGAQEPTSTAILKFARYFGVTTDYLLGIED